MKSYIRYGSRELRPFHTWICTWIQTWNTMFIGNLLGKKTRFALVWLMYIVFYIRIESLCYIYIWEIVLSIRNEKHMNLSYCRERMSTFIFIPLTCSISRCVHNYMVSTRRVSWRKFLKDRLFSFLSLQL